MFSIIFEKRALHDLNKLDILIKQRIWDKLQVCKEDPFRFLEHLEEIDGLKLRIGDYRVILDVDKTNQVLRVLKVGHRKNIYDN
ncbi:MAG: type II toxin-antitoxin system RelE/ParE family toxin [Candidatus Pacearchaeota archaeon]|nr:type II toxin-antitoxin system RelE/ParE family toxin [Candidatus Pacearchaeota archaeon]